MFETFPSYVRVWIVSLLLIWVGKDNKDGEYTLQVQMKVSEEKMAEMVGKLAGKLAVEVASVSHEEVCQPPM